jgi:hypothetical protein
MSVRIHSDDLGRGYEGNFPDPAGTPNLGKYSMGDSGYSWNDQISSLYTSTPLLVAEDAQYQGFQAVLSPGFHPLESLERYGFYNDSISSFRALPEYYA